MKAWEGTVQKAHTELQFEALHRSVFLPLHMLTPLSSSSSSTPTANQKPLRL